MSIAAIFFDIGGTLGTVDLDSRSLTPFDNMARLLKTAAQVFRIPVGVITNIPDDWTRDDVKNLLRSAGLLEFLDTRGIVTSADAQASKPDVRIYRFAAQRLAVETSECLFIDDDAGNIAGAGAAGMSAIQYLGANLK